MSRFKIGEKVVCIYARNQNTKDGDLVVKGKTYTVSYIVINDGVKLKGMTTGSEYCGYKPERFAPLKEDGSTAELNLCIEEFKLETIEYN